MKFYINGSWVESESDQIYEDVNPATGEVIAEFPSATDREIEAALMPPMRPSPNGGRYP